MCFKQTKWTDDGILHRTHIPSIERKQIMKNVLWHLKMPCMLYVTHSTVKIQSIRDERTKGTVANNIYNTKKNIMRNKCLKSDHSLNTIVRRLCVRTLVRFKQFFFFVPLIQRLLKPTPTKLAGIFSVCERDGRYSF